MVTFLRLKPLEISDLVVVQGARISRIMNGKSLLINSFPRLAIFARMVEKWRNEIVVSGCVKEDALFPAA